MTGKGGGKPSLLPWPKRRGQVAESGKHERRRTTDFDARNAALVAATDAHSTGVRIGNRGPVLAGLFLFLALFVGVGGWFYAANLSGAVIAQGIVAVQGKPKTIQHLDGGIVTEIGIADGDRVEQGEVLVRLDNTLLEANLQIYRGRLREAVARRARLVAERDDLPEIDWDEELLALLEVEQDDTIRLAHQRLFDVRRTALQGQIARLDEQIAQLQDQAVGVDALKGARDRQVGVLGEEFAKMAHLLDDGLVTSDRVMNLEIQMEELKGQIGGHDAELARIASSISEARIRILQLQHEAHQSVLAQLRETEQEVEDMAQRFHATVEQLRRTDIKAPVNGIVHELSVFTIGGVIGPGVPIMQIIPQDEELVVEASVESQFIDELYPEQPATLHFSAFNLSTTPAIEGTVNGISANAVLDEQTGAPFYKVHLSVSPAELSRLGGLALIPGMPVEVFFTTRERTVLNYLVKPLLDQVNRAFREE